MAREVMLPDITGSASEREETNSRKPSPGFLVWLLQFMKISPSQKFNAMKYFILMQYDNM